MVQLARILPKAEQLFATPRQRLDQAGERLGLGLSRNLQIHRARLAKASALLRPRPIENRIAHAREKLAALETPGRYAVSGPIWRRNGDGWKGSPGC